MGFTLEIAIISQALVGQVVLRGHLTPDPAPLISVGIDGVELGGQPQRVLSWGAVKLVEGTHAADAEAFRELSDELWRATSRLARGDAPGALSPFDLAYEQLADSRGISRLHAAEGRAEAYRQIGRGAEATDAWLVALQLQREGVALDKASGVEPILHIDGETGLSAGLPPMWAPAAQLTAIVDAASFPTIDEPDPVVASIASLYRRAARFEIDMPLDDAALALDERVVDLPGIVFVRDIVLARTGAPQQRGAAREALRAAIEGNPSSDPNNWPEAWRRVALARSLLREGDRESGDEALLHLAHLPARFAQTQPYLAGLALAEMAVEMRRRGARREADQLIRELEDSYSWHPARAWVASEMQRLTMARANAHLSEATSSP